VTDTQTGFQVVMPKLGLTMTEATLVEWLKQEGDPVEKGELLFVLESEKSILEIESPASGVLHILVATGTTVPVQTPIALLVGARGGPLSPQEEVTGQPAEGGPPALDDSTAAGGPTTVAARQPDRPIAASPKARVLANRLGLSLEGIAGSGPRGMVVAADVEASAGTRPAIKASPVARNLARRADLDLATVAGTGPSGRVMRQDVERALGGAEQAQAGDGPPAPPGIQPLSGLRAVIAERLSASWRERPHVTLTTEVDATNLASARQQAMAELGQKVSYDALLVALVARALREHPQLNVRLTDAGLEQVPNVHIGVAVDTERGLLVPVVRDADTQDLGQILATLHGLLERALSGRSLPDDLTGGTFTITNLGMFEIDAFTPIINPPESAILGVGRILSKPVGLGGQIVLRDMMTLSLSFDHRLVDGAPAARFLQRVKQLIERPFALALST